MHLVRDEVVSIARGNLSLINFVVLIVVFTVEPVLSIVHLWDQGEIIDDVLGDNFLRSRINSI